MMLTTVIFANSYAQQDKRHMMTEYCTTNWNVDPIGCVDHIPKDYQVQDHTTLQQEIRASHDDAQRTCPIGSHPGMDLTDNPICLDSKTNQIVTNAHTLHENKTLTINVSEDTYTHFTPPYDNQSFNGQGLITKYHFDYYGGKDNRKTWLKFDLPTVPSKISHAVLRMYLTNVETNSSLVDVYRYNYSNWYEKTITYDNEPAHFATLSAGPFVEQSLNGTNEYHEWDVTNAITTNPNNKVVTLVLVGNSLNDGTGFADKESGKSPQLVIKLKSGQ